MTSLRNGEIAILPRSKWVFDVFTGTGWKNHSCFQLTSPNGFVKLLGGLAVSANDYEFIVKHVGGGMGRK
mgnify:CR=1 FL=1